MRTDGFAQPGKGVWPGGSPEVPSLREAHTVSAPGFRGQSRDQKSHARLVTVKTQGNAPRGENNIGAKDGEGPT